MKTRILLFFTFILILLLVCSCATTSRTKVISRSEPLSGDKAYLASVCYYANPFRITGSSYDPYAPYILLSNANKEWVTIEFARDFPGNKRPHIFLIEEELCVVEIEPGEYTVKGIYKMDGILPKKIMRIPPYLKAKITLEPGSITYLGDFSITKSTLSLFGIISFETIYDHDFDRFQNKLDQEFNVPETIELNSP